MLDDPQGSGAGAADLLVRRGRSWESAKRLQTLATLAGKAGFAQNGVSFGHGVSVSSPKSNALQARDPHDSVSASRRTLEEAGFEVRHTPTKKDSDHHTIQLPKPVTDEIAAAFNATFGRSRSKRI